jgi:lipoprotein-releasing system permease protein
LAAAFALLSCLAASYLPARRAGRVHPVDILRGAA